MMLLLNLPYLMLHVAHQFAQPVILIRDLLLLEAKVASRFGAFHHKSVRYIVVSADPFGTE